MRRKRVMGAVCLAMVLVGILAFLSRPNAALESAHETILNACPDPLLVDDFLLVALVDGEDWGPDCRLALHDAAVTAGIAEGEVAAVLDGTRAYVVGNGIRLSIARSEPVESEDLEVTFVELADCRRTIAPLDPDDWSAGIPWDRFWYSRCDIEPTVEIRPIRSS